MKIPGTVIIRLEEILRGASDDPEALVQRLVAGNTVLLHAQVEAFLPEILLVQFTFQIAPDDIGDEKSAVSGARPFEAAFPLLR